LRTLADGIVFDSAGEPRRWEELKLLERAGKITELRRQVKFPLQINMRPVMIRSPGYPSGRRCGCTADFTYYETDFPHTLTVEEHKGCGPRRHGCGSWWPRRSTASGCC
jgi:hypothetical protein